MPVNQTLAKILALSQLNADLTIPQIAASLKLKEHTIRYALDAALESGLLRRSYFINLFKLGYMQHEIYFSLSSAKKGARTLLVNKLIASDQISWIGRLGGDYHYGINICTKSTEQMVDLISKLSNIEDGIFLDKSLALRLSLTFFGNRYTNNSNRRKPIAFKSTNEKAEIDQLDHKILQSLNKSGNLSVHALSRLLKIPQTTLDFRIKRLKTSGVIVGSYYSLASSKIGMQTFMCLVSTKGFSDKLRQKVLQFCDIKTEVVILVESLGSWDFQLIIHASQSEEAAKFSEDFLDYFGNEIHWLKILPLFSYIKVAEYPFSN